MNRIVFQPWFFNAIPILVWFLLLVLPFLSPPPGFPAEEHSGFLLHILLTNLLMLAFFYIHTYLLYPLIKHRAMLSYITGLVVLIAAYWLGWWFLRIIPAHNNFFRIDHGGPNHPVEPIFNGGPGGFFPLLSTGIVLLCSFCYGIILENNNRAALLKEKETAHLRTELNFLRSQINPHFLFNILNNLTSLARKKSERLEPAIISLSQIMRYMLYDSSDNKVPLAMEIEFLENYINLQKLRFGKELIVECAFSKNIHNCLIGPMLFIPLVENAFKYGTENIHDNLIMIELSVPKDQSKLCFQVINFYVAAESNAGKGAGVGLKNIQRRLELLYPQKHELIISTTESRYTVMLSLDLT